MRIKKLLTSIFTTFVVAVMSTIAFADTGADLSGIVDSNVSATTIAKKVIGAVKTPVQVAAVTIAVVLILVRGAILGAIQDERKRAEVGKTFMWVIVSLFIVFFGISIVSLIVNQIKTNADAPSSMLSLFYWLG